MSDLRISPVGGPVLTAGSPTLAAGKPGGGGVFREALAQVNRLQQAADQASQAFALGETRDVASTLITIEKANLAFQLTLHIRNKVVEAYQEVMRMTI